MARRKGTILECRLSETDKGFKEGKIKPDGKDEPILEFTRCPHNFQVGDRVIFESIGVRSAAGGAKGIARKVEPLLD